MILVRRLRGADAEPPAGDPEIGAFSMSVGRDRAEVEARGLREYSTSRPRGSAACVWGVGTADWVLRCVGRPAGRWADPCPAPEAGVTTDARLPLPLPQSSGTGGRCLTGVVFAAEAGYRTWGSVSIKDRNEGREGSEGMANGIVRAAERSVARRSGVE